MGRLNESELEETVHHRLREAGWSDEAILRNERLVSRSTVLAPDLVLLEKGCPVAVVEVKGSGHSSMVRGVDQVRLSMDAIGGVLGLVSDGSLPVQVLPSAPPKQLSAWPTPADVVASLGWGRTAHDPRFQPIPAENFKLRLFGAMAVGRVLDAIVAGKQRIHLVMGQGSGVNIALSVLAWKLLLSGFCRRILYVADRRLVADQANLVFKRYGLDSEAFTVENGGTDCRLRIATIQGLLEHLGQIPNDLFDFIILQNAEQPRPFARIMEHFRDAVALAVAHTTSISATEQYGSPVWEYSLEQVVNSDGLKPPEGFRTVQLGDIAEIKTGLHAAYVSDADASIQGAVRYLRGSDLRDDGHVDVSNGRWVRVGPHVLDEARKLKAGDILVPVINPAGRLRAGRIPSGIESVTFASSLLRIRPTTPDMPSEELLAVLRSDAVALAARQLAASLKGDIRLSVGVLSSLPVFLPERKDAKRDATPTSSHPGEGLGATASVIRELEDRVLPLLRRYAAQEQSQVQEPSTVVVARALRSLAAVLEPPTLAERVIASYPMPIALAYRRFQDARFNIYEQVNRLRDVFEAAAFYLSNIVLADVLYRLDASAYQEVGKIAGKVCRGHSMADRMNFVQKVLQIAGRRNSPDLFVPELAKADAVAHIRRLQADFRNVQAHTATPMESLARKRLEDFKPVVDALLLELDFLPRYRLVNVPSFYGRFGKLTRRMVVFSSVVPWWDEEEVEAGALTVPPDHDRLVLLDEDGDVLNLFPFYQFIAHDETQHESHLCVFKGVRNGAVRGESLTNSRQFEMPGHEELRKLLDRWPKPPGVGST